jgi:hypothetical protein
MANPCAAGRSFGFIGHFDRFTITERPGCFRQCARIAAHSGPPRSRRRFLPVPSLELLGGFRFLINRAFCKIGKLFICAFFFGEGGVEQRHGLVEAKFLRPGL